MNPGFSVRSSPRSGKQRGRSVCSGLLSLLQLFSGRSVVIAGPDLVLHLVGGVVDLVLDARNSAVTLALALELLVVSEVAGRFLRAALRLIDVLPHSRSSPF